MKKLILIFLQLGFIAFFIPLSSAQTPVGQPKSDLLFVLDVSGSMNGVLDNALMIDWAKKAIIETVAVLPSDAEVGLRVYAHRIEQSNKEASCTDSELLVPISSGNGPQVASAVNGLKPKGWTPIAYSLQQVASDFRGDKERLHTIILVSDGEETCGGDPLVAAKELTNQGFRLKIFTVGFNVEEVARQQLELLANEFGGTYSDVKTGANLQTTLIKLTEQTFLIEKEKEENRVRGGDTIGSAVPLKLGKFYMLDHHQRKGERDYFVLSLKPGQGVKISVKPVEKCVEIQGNQVEEVGGKSYCPGPEAFHLDLLDKSQKILITLESKLTNQSIESDFFYVPSGTGEKNYYLAYGSDTADIHKDNQFAIFVEESPGDAGTEKDAGDTLSTALAIKPGVYEVNFLSEGDKVDIFKVEVPKGATLKIALNSQGELSLGGIVLGELGEKVASLNSFTEYSFESELFSSSQTVYVKVEHQSQSGNYSLGVLVKE